MREIKFRAWDKEEKIMWEPLELDQIIRADWELETNPYEYTLPWKDYMFSQHDKTVWMQYTGIKDKNGKEIYEGDVLKYEDELGLTDDFVEAVEWIDNEYTAGFGTKTSEHVWGEVSRLSEVIGDIYTSPELLK